jgi:hypothetical protein
MIGSQKDTLVCADRQTCDGPVRLIGLGAVKTVHQVYHVLHKGRFHDAVHLQDAFESVFETASFIIGLVVVLVDVGHDDDAGDGLSRSPEAVGGLVDLALADPGGLIAAGAVQEVEHRVSLVRFIIVGREIYDEPAVGGAGNTARLNYLFYNAFRGIIGPDGGPWQITF